MRPSTSLGWAPTQAQTRHQELRSRLQLKPKAPSPSKLGPGLQLKPKFKANMGKPKTHFYHKPGLGLKPPPMGKPKRLQTPSQPTTPTGHHQLHQQPPWQQPSSPFLFTLPRRPLQRGLMREKPPCFRESIFTKNDGFVSLTGMERR